MTLRRDPRSLLHGALVLTLTLVGNACGSKSPTTPSAPTLGVTAISPAAGSTTGAIDVLINGANFGADTTVTIGGLLATNVVVQSPTSLLATIGAHPAAGAADVVVTSGGHTAMLTRGFTFIAPSGANQPPVIGTIRSIGTRSNQPSGFADLDETVTLVANVADAETSLGDLIFTWTGPGTFSGSAGGSVFWRLPASADPTPVPMTATLIVTEPFVEGGITHKNVSQPASFVMQVHNSQKEILDMGEDFLTLFSRSEVSTNDVLHNFSTTCDGGRGRDEEKADTDAAHASYVQDFSKFTIARLPPVTFNFGGRCPFRLRLADACSQFHVHWEVTYIKADLFHKVGQHETTDGIDYVTAVLENNRWRLCHSDFTGTSTNPLTGFTRLVEW